MNRHLFAVVALLLAASTRAHLQGIQLGEVLIVCRPSSPGASFESTIKTSIPKWNQSIPGVHIQLFKADRGDHKGESLLVCSADTKQDRSRLPSSPYTGNVFTVDSRPLSELVSKPTEYHLVGSSDFKNLPRVSLLGMHYTKVRPDRSAEFEKFVIDKLHPAVGGLLPDMQLLYYKAEGEVPASYVTVFAITSPAARDKYWPSGAPETEVLKAAFRPHNMLAEALGSFLVEGSYLQPGGGAAAYFESREWTDYVLEEP